MSKISIYEVVPVPKLADRLIGTSVGGQIEDVTYNFTLSELLNLFIPNIPANGLQGVLDIGNTATQDIDLFGTITTTYLDVTDTANLFITYLNQETHIVGSVYDSLDLIGAAGAVLTSTGSGVQWVTLPPIFTPNLQQVLTVGNTANLDIILSANIVALDINTDTETVNNNITIDGTITDGYSSLGPVNQVLSSTGTKVKWVNLPVYSATSPLLFNSVTGVFSIQQAGSTQNGYLSSSDWITFDGKQNAGNYITALTGQATANGPGSASIILNNSSVIAKVLTGLNVTGGSISAADSILTAFGKVQGQLNGLVGGVFFKGSWNALINNPTLTSSVGTQGWYYIVSVAGNTNLNGITDWQVGDWAIFNGTTWDKIDNTDSVTSVNGQIGAVSLTTDNIPEGATNLYYLDSRARTAISLTTIGTSGAATYNNTTGVFNIPAYVGGVISFNGRTGAVVPTEGDYTLTELGDVTITAPITGQVLKYNGAIWINDTDANTGTVTSVSFTLGSSGTDLNSSVTNSTTTPLITLNVPTASATNRGALSSTDWSTFNSKESVLTFSSPLVRTTNTISIPVATTSVDGYLSSTDWNTFNNKQATISLTTTGTSGAATFIANTLNIPQYQASGTYVTSVTGTSPIVSSGGTTPAISIPAATGSVDGYLTSTDWTTFNNKANALSGTLNTVPKFTSASTIGDSNIKDNGSAVTVNATAGSFGALQVGNYNGNILMNTTNTSGGLIFQNTSSSNKLWDFSSYNNDINFNESGVATPVMTLKTGGNVGIKTTIPSFLLDVAGTFGATGIVTLGNLAGSGSRMVIADSSGVLSTQAITTGTVTAVTASSPLFSSGGNTPNITIQQSSGSQDGYLSSTDWTTFNNKQAAGNYITSLTGEATGSGPGAATVTLNNAAVTGKILTGINITGGTVLDTDSILIGFGKLQNQVNGLVGGSTYQGTWNANTNTPTLTSSVGTAGYYYIVSVAGNTNLNGITDWQVGDWAIFNGGVWQKVDNTDAVVSVNGQTGAVSLTTDNIPEGTTNLYYLDSRARAALSFAAGSGAYSSSTGVITIPTNTSQLTNGANFITLASLNGTSPIVYNNTTGNISINQSGTASNGYLSSTDWNTFNGKQNTITNPVTGTGTSGQVAYFNSTSSITGESNLFWDSTNDRLGIGTATPANTLDVIRGTAGAMGRGVYESASFSFNGDMKFGLYTSAAAGLGGASLLFGATNFTAAGTYPGFEVQFSPSATLASNYIRFNSVGRDATGTVVSATSNILCIFQSANVVVGSGTDSGFRFDVNGTTRITGQLTLGSTITNGTYTYTLPSATGTLALTSALSGYLPLTGGTLTGALGGTSASFSGQLIFPSTSKMEGSVAPNFILASTSAAGSGNGPYQTFKTNSSDFGYIGSEDALMSTTGNKLALLALNGLSFRTGSSYLERLSIASTGAATFSSSVTAGSSSATNYATLQIMGASTSPSLTVGTAANVVFAMAAGQELAITANGTAPYGVNFQARNSLAGGGGSGTSYPIIFNPLGGNVGIGTASPSFSDFSTNTQGLQIANSVGTNYAGLKLTGNQSITTGSLGIYSGGATHYFWGGGANPMVFAVNDVERMRITSGGNVLIGTTTDAGYKLDVNGTGRFSGVTTFTKSSNGTIGLVGNMSQEVGTSADGAGKFSGFGFGYNGGSYYPAYMAYYVSSGGGNTQGELRFAVRNSGSDIAATSALTIASTGAATFSSSVNVNGGTLGGTLSVNGTNDVYAAIFKGGNTAGSSYGPYIRAGSNSSDISFQVRDVTEANLYFRIKGNGGIILNNEVFNVNTSGTTRTLFIGNGDFSIGGVSSIRASKKNIENLSKVDWLYKLNPVTFNYRKKDSTGNYTENIYEEINYGLIAEDTEPIAQFLINYNNKKDGTKEMIGIEYSRLITPMLKAIQELSAKNEALIKRIETLENK